MTVTVGSGSYRYDVAEGWGKLPEGYEWGQIGALLRSTGRVKRGIGTIRQDLNVPVADGRITEIEQVLERNPQTAQRVEARPPKGPGMRGNA